MTETRAQPPAATSELRRSLGFTDLVLLAIGTVIGSGIFLVPSVVLRQTGGETFSAMIVWVVAGVLSLLGALTYAELGAMKPEVGHALDVRETSDAVQRAADDERAGLRDQPHVRRRVME